jgi:hypothetical protein
MIIALSIKVEQKPCILKKGKDGNTSTRSTRQTRGVSYCRLAIYMEKYLKGKGELWKLKYFTMLKHNLQKIL